MVKRKWGWAPFWNSGRTEEERRNENNLNTTTRKGGVDHQSRDRLRQPDTWKSNGQLPSKIRRKTQIKVEFHQSSGWNSDLDWINARGDEAESKKFKGQR